MKVGLDGGELDGEVFDALGVGALEGIGDANEGGEFGDADAVDGGEVLVDEVVDLGAGFAVVAGDEGDEEAIVIIESEDFGVADDVEGVEFVRLWRDVVADFVKEGGDLKEEGVVFGELVEVLGAFEELAGKVGDVACVLHVDVIPFCSDGGGVKHLFFQLFLKRSREGEVGEESLFVVGAGDAEGVEMEGLGDGGVDDEGGEDGAGCLVVEAVFLDALLFGDGSDVVGELFKNGVA